MDTLSVLEKRIEELEIQAAWQQDLLESLNQTVARLNDTCALQQEMLRLLYRRVEGEGHNNPEPWRSQEEIPPHY